VSVAKQTPALFGSRAIVNASALVFAASMVLSVGGFAFHAIASRRLGVDDYGSFYALISLMGIGGLPIAIFTPVVARYSAEFAAIHDDGHVRGLIVLILRIFAVFGALYVTGGIALSHTVSAYLHVATWQVPIVGVMLAVGIASGALRAIGQGVHAYGAFATSLAGEGIVKVIALVLVGLLGLTIAGAAGAFLCGLIAGATLIAIPLSRAYRGVTPAPIFLDWARIFATTGGAAVLTLTMTCIGFADVLLVKHFFPAADAGLYAAASLSGKILLYSVGFVPTILIPQATHRHARKESTRRILWAAIAFVGAVSVVGVLAYSAFGAVLLHVLVGHEFDAALQFLPTYAAAMAALAMTNCLCSYGMATHRLGYALPLLIATVGTLALIALVHPSLTAVVNELLIGNLVMVACVAIPLAIQGARKARA
jgi:O-antigen/teichoic acid export membrane protein